MSERRHLRRVRFGLRTLLCVPLIVGGLWWWTTWPERTADQFVKLMAAGDLDGAQRMLKPPRSGGKSASEAGKTDGDLWHTFQRGEVRFDSPTIEPRSFLDWLVAEGDFEVNADSQGLWLHYGHFTARRGTIEPSDQLKSQTLTVYRTRYIDAVIAFERVKNDFKPGSPVMLAADADANTLLLFGSPDANAQLQTLLKRIDLKPLTKAGPSQRGSEYERLRR